MSFPQALGGTLFHESDFDNLGYLTTLPAFMEALALQEQGGMTCTIASAVNFTAPSSISVTVATGLNLAVGMPCTVHLTATPTTVYYGGLVASYDSSTGSLSVVYGGTFHIGTGSGAATVIAFSGSMDNTNVDAVDKTDVLLVDRGGLGNTIGNTVDGFGFLGVGSPTMHMSEVFEEFTEPVTDNIYLDYYPFTVVCDQSNPFSRANGAPLSVAKNGADINDSFNGSLVFNPSSGIASTLPAHKTSVFYGAKPWLSLAPGGDVYLEFKFYVTSALTATDIYRFGWAGYTSSRLGNVFSRCGLGFYIQGGFLFCIYSAYGQTYTQALFAPVTAAAHICRIEIYRATGVVAWFVDNVEIMRLSYAHSSTLPANGQAVTDNMTTTGLAPLITSNVAGISIPPSEAMMWPVMAAEYTTAVPTSAILIDYLYIRNFLIRGF